jgi:hypothetical protein
MIFLFACLSQSTQQEREREREREREGYKRKSGVRKNKQQRKPLQKKR